MKGRVHYVSPKGSAEAVAEAIARVKGMDPEEAARITLENGTRFFRIEF